MAIVVIPNPLLNGTTANGSDVIADINAIASDYNGNIQDVNIASGANISNSKLAAITSAGLVNGTALTNLSGIPSGAGVVPTVNLPGGGSTPGSLLALSNKYVFNFTGVTTLPTAGAIYTNNSQVFVVTSSSGTGIAGSLAGAVYTTGSSAPTPTGALVKSSGTGDATITYSEVTAQLPALDGSLLTNLPLTGLGTYVSKSANTSYVAATDGFVIAYGKGGLNQTANISVVVNGTTIGQMASTSTTTDAATTMTIPVALGETWIANIGGNQDDGTWVYWKPFGV